MSNWLSKGNHVFTSRDLICSEIRIHYIRLMGDKWALYYEKGTFEAVELFTFAQEHAPRIIGILMDLLGNANSFNNSVIEYL